MPAESRGQPADIVARPYPRFLGIGVPKAASTWLYHNLRLHPEIWMPPVKELHFFDSHDPKWNCSFWSPLWRKQFQLLFVRRLLRRKGLTIDPHLDARWRDSTGKGSSRRLSLKLKCELETIRWHWNYLFSRRDEDWYASLFEAGTGRITGEVTPSYCTMDPTAVRRVHELMPRAKIVLILRNPIFRAWSHARMMFHAVEHRSINSVSDEEYIKFFTCSEMTHAGDYLSMLGNWGRYYAEEQIFIGFFEEIAEDSPRFLGRVLRFLGATSPAHPAGELVGRRILAGPEVSMGQKTALFLAEMYYDPIKQLKDRLGGYAGLWLEEAETILSKRGLPDRRPAA
jgi:hypothetical protein